jgi:hypothetical protein
MKTLRFEADSGTFAAFAGDGAANAEALTDWATERLAAGTILGLDLGRRAIGRDRQWVVGHVTPEELDEYLPRLEEAFAFPITVGKGPLQLGDPLAAPDRRESLDVPPGQYWAGVYPVSPEETFADFLLVFIPADDLAADERWPTLPQLDAAGRTPNEIDSPVPLPPYDDIPEGNAANFMANLFGTLSSNKKPAPGEPLSPFHRALQALVDAELLELVDPGGLGKLADRLEDEAGSDPFLIPHIGTWLVDQDEVDDVFGEDKELETIVRSHLG